ncbi:alpha/beta hydrolase [Kitasatospora mediocidica]|uniref:alpha/beta hydrolase n=1 Tax=Kitasatospora mediocidica TaxID=58352 RepID=UPI00055DC139|nr:alpha/beta hydrolase [Kitasatospora mediocidica]
MDIATLMNADTNGLASAQAAYEQLTAEFGQHVGAWRSTVTDRLDDTRWSGATAVQVRADLAAFTGKMQAAHDELSLVGGTLSDAARSFALAQAQLVQALDDAAAAHLTVKPDGSITWDNDPSSATYAGASARARATDVSTRIAAALTEADQADQLISARLKHFTDNATSGTGLDSATAGADQRTEAARENIPAQGSTPAQVKAWWAGLTPAEQQDLINNHPDQVGNLDGVPSPARDQANRLGLSRIRTDLQGQIAQLGPEPPRFDGVVTDGFPVETMAHMEWREKHDELQGQLDGFNSIQDRLDMDDQRVAADPSHHPKDYLLGIGTQGQGRAILAFGNPDTATDVSTYVPGMTTTLSSLGMDSINDPGANEANNALNLYNAANEAELGNGSAASVVWLGYDAPPGPPSVASPDRGQVGAPAYANFLTGLRATNTGAQPQHITSIGHSYGSFLVGQATMLSTHQPNAYTPPDDVVLIGSPGTGAGTAADLGLPGHVWVGEAAFDPITYAPGCSPNSRWFGTDPASSSFGAHRFSVADGSPVHWLRTHTEYLTPQNGGPSLGNIANIVVGSPDKVRPEADRW